jgi:hypothetical protein
MQAEDRRMARTSAGVNDEGPKATQPPITASNVSARQQRLARMRTPRSS